MTSTEQRLMEHLTHFTGVPVLETDSSSSKAVIMVNGHPKSLAGKGLIGLKLMKMNRSLSFLK